MPEIKVKVECLYDPERTSGNKLQLTMEGATVKDPDTDEKVGHVKNVLPAGLQIGIEKSKRLYSIDIQDLFSQIVDYDEEY